jgi:protein-tyrosine phosphatase
MPEGSAPNFGVYLLGRQPPSTEWESRWIAWPDFRLPRSPRDAAAALLDAHGRAAAERVEVACGGGRGRTGTALACLAVIAGVPAADAVAFVREHYHHRAVETPAQRRFVRRFPDLLDGV